MDVALRVLAEPRRQAILRLVRDQEMAAGDIAAHFDVTRPAISQHLTVLREAGFVDERRVGARRLYRARPQAIADLRRWLDDFWAGSLARLRDAVEAEERTMEEASTPVDEGVLEHEIRIAASPETVFSYLVDPDRLVRWMGDQATLEARPGGVFRLVYARGDVARGEVVEVRPPELLVITWGWEADGDPTPPGSSRVEFSVVPDGDGSIVRVRHSGLVEEARAGHAEGWDWFLPRLAAAVATG
jgi:uncharacterized protein YndB with AHSA1/START domain/DNA-binding transcriptional ArsR family regulator